MASEGVKDWDLPLPTSSDSGEEEQEVDQLQYYVSRMAYRPVDPPKARPRTEEIALPTGHRLVSTYYDYKDIYDPQQRAHRMKRLAAKYEAISADQMENIVRIKKLKEKKKECLELKKQMLYYDMINKLEKQCRSQYLHFLIKKFAEFIANMATSMEIPKELAEPYGRMQRGIFCNIIKLVGIKPKSPMAFYYNTQDANEYEVCHNLAHALLSLIIKALDAAVKKDPSELESMNCGTDVTEMDNYIKERLMCAAAKKIRNNRTNKKSMCRVYQECDDFARC